MYMLYAYQEYVYQYQENEPISAVSQYLNA